MSTKKFPSVEKFNRIVRYANDSSIDYRGTVKLHGCNTGTLLLNDKLYIRSRHKQLTENDDFHDFYKFVHEHENILKEVAKVITSNLPIEFEEIRKKKLLTGSHDYEVCFYGEYCGPGIQKGVGISLLKQRILVIFQITVDDVWLPLTSWEKVLFGERIYNIQQFPFWDITIDFNNPNDAIDEMNRLTMEVGSECPVAKSLGIIGSGEGIVWVPRIWSQGTDPTNLWFKTRADRISLHHKNHKPKSVDDLVNNLVSLLDEARLDQAIEYKQETGIKNFSEISDHIIANLLREESDQLEVLSETQLVKFKNICKGKIIMHLKANMKIE